MTEEDTPRLKRKLAEGLELPELVEWFGRPKQTIYGWIKRFGLHTLWRNARGLVTYRKVKVGPRATYLSDEEQPDGTDKEIRGIKLGYNRSTPRAVSRLAWESRWR
jgi:hypothetical protein